MKKIINKYIKNKKGISSIQTAIGVFIVLICICAFMDLSTTMYKFNALSTTATYVTRIAEKQGGITTIPPSSYRGEFTSSTDVYNDVKTIMNNAGINDSQWDVYVNGGRLNGFNDTPVRYYGEDVVVEVKVRYGWNMVKNFLRMNQEYEKTATRTTKSSLIKRESNVNTQFR